MIIQYVCNGKRVALINDLSICFHYKTGAAR